MSLFLPLKTATVLLPSGPAGNEQKPHLFVLLTDPLGDAKEVFAVPISTYLDDGTDDEACKLFAGDHEFIKTKSFVRYRRARVECAQTLINGAKDGVFKPMACLDTPVFARVCHGVSVSTFIRPAMKAFFEAAIAE